MKTAFKIIMLLAIAGALIYSIVRPKEDPVCTGTELEVEDSLALGLINSDEVEDIIASKKLKFEGRKLSDINLGNVTRTLMASPYIDTVMCTFTAAGKVHLNVIPKIPALHVIAANGEEYYLDRNGDDMPVGDINGNLSIATGNITKAFAREKLAPLARCIQDSTFWRAQVQQIEVNNDHDVRLYTRIADHAILLGELSNLEEKLWRMRIFYEQGLPQTGWNRYETVSVAYNGIIVGQKKGSAKKLEEAAAAAAAQKAATADVATAAPEAEANADNAATEPNDSTQKPQ